MEWLFYFFTEVINPYQVLTNNLIETSCQLRFLVVLNSREVPQRSRLDLSLSIWPRSCLPLASCKVILRLLRVWEMPVSKFWLYMTFPMSSYVVQLETTTVWSSQLPQTNEQSNFQDSRICRQLANEEAKLSQYCQLAFLYSDYKIVWYAAVWSLFKVHFLGA